MNVNPTLTPTADHVTDTDHMVDWQQEAQRLRCILGDLRREINAVAVDVAPTIPEPHRSRFLRNIAAMERKYTEAA